MAAIAENSREFLPTLLTKIPRYGKMQIAVNRQGKPLLFPRRPHFAGGISSGRYARKKSFHACEEALFSFLPGTAAPRRERGGGVLKKLWKTEYRRRAAFLRRRAASRVSALLRDGNSQSLRGDRCAFGGEAAQRSRRRRGRAPLGGRSPALRGGVQTPRRRPYYV